MVLADVFGETQVVQLRRDRDATVVSVSIEQRSHDHCCGQTDVTTDLLAQCFPAIYRYTQKETVDQLLILAAF